MAKWREEIQAAADPISASANTPQRNGPESASKAGARSGSHGTYGITQSHISASGAVTRSDAVANAAVAPTAVTATATHSFHSGASRATRTGPSGVQSTMWIDAGSSQSASATPSETQMSRARRAT